MDRIDNYVGYRGPAARRRIARVVRRVPRRALEDASERLLFGPFDATFGEEVDGNLILPPAPAAFLIFRDPAGAREHGRRADLRSRNVLVYFAGRTGPRYLRAVKSCL